MKDWGQSKISEYSVLFQRGMDEENENVEIYWVDARIIDEPKKAQ